jgi:hypothetical protein
MRRSRLSSCLAALLLLAPVATGARAAERFDSVAAALEQGIEAYKGGYYGIAVDALQHAAQKDDILALFYLGRIYSNNTTAFTDHPRAYKLYQRIVSLYGDIDPDRMHHARFVAKALTAVAGYVLKGLPEIGLRPDAARAAQFLTTAASVWNEPDAQYELAKLYLRGEGVPADPEFARHWLIVLTKKGHAPAQAYFADMLWRGRFVPQDKNQALALITLAVENAPPEDRVWIEDIYQNIFCGTSMGTRRQANGLVAVWSRAFGRPEAPAGRSSLGALLPRATRACGNGEAVPMPLPIGAARDADLLPPKPQTEAAVRPASPPAIAPPRMASEAPASGFVQGSTSMGLIDAGAKTLSKPSR